MKHLSLAERLGRTIRNCERRAVRSFNVHHVDHRFFHDFLLLSVPSRRRLIIRLMIAGEGHLPAVPKTDDKRWRSQHITLLDERVQELLFQYGTGVLVFDHLGRTHFCSRTGYIPGDRTILAIHNFCADCSGMIRNILDKLGSSRGRREFLTRLRIFSEGKTVRRDIPGPDYSDRQLKLCLDR
jgi:hypothetical protein